MLPQNDQKRYQNGSSDSPNQDGQRRTRQVSRIHLPILPNEHARRTTVACWLRLDREKRQRFSLTKVDIEPLSGGVGVRVLFCGVREFANRRMLTSALNRLHLERGIA